MAKSHGKGNKGKQNVPFNEQPMTVKGSAPNAAENTSAVFTAADESTAQESDMSESSNGSGAITLTLKRIQKNGIATYNQEGVNASVYFNKTMFVGDPPQNVQIIAAGLTKPGESPVAGRAVDQTKLTERATKAQERAAKALERANKAKANAEKLAKRAGIKGEEVIEEEVEVSA